MNVSEFEPKDGERCIACPKDGQQEKAVHVIVSVVKQNFVRTPLCGRHHGEWRFWRDLVYREPSEPPVGSA